MAKAKIPVDLFNPGQVFACMGYLEVAELLIGHVEGGFDWTNDAQALFEINTDGSENPFGTVLDFLTRAKMKQLVPRGYVNASTPDRQRKSTKAKRQAGVKAAEAANGACLTETVETFPARVVDERALPIRFERDGQQLDVSHWADGSSRVSFKLFAGQQRSEVIAQCMLDAIRKLLKTHRDQIIHDPFDLIMPLGGSSFKFDPRKSWTGIDAGYSPDEQSHDVQASPIVEMLAALGFEHARPDEYETRKVRYGVWQGPVPLVLARAAMAGIRLGVPMRVFRFTLELAGKNKNVTFAQEETNA
jgi:CRISPR-associated protein Csx14